MASEKNGKKTHSGFVEPSKPEQEYKRLADSIPDVFFALDRDLRCTYWNRASEELMDISAGDANGKTLQELFPGPVSERFAQTLRDVLNAQKTVVFPSEYPIRGEMHLFEVSAYPFEDGVAVMSRDVTAKKQAESAIRESGERYRRLVENMLEGVAYYRMLYDEHGDPADWVYLSVNSNFEPITGLRDVVGKKVTEVIPGIRESNPELFEAYGRVASTGEPEEFESELKSLGLHLRISVFRPEKNHFVALFEDITQRKQAENALRASEAKFRQLVDVAHEGIWSLDVDAKTTFVNPAMARMLGYTAEEMIGRELFEFMDSSGVEIAKERLMIQMGRVSGRDDYVFLRKDGLRMTAALGTSPILDDDGGTIGVMAVVADVTAKRAAEEEVRKSRELFFRTFQSFPVTAMIVRAADKRIQAVNDAFCKVFGYSREEVVGKRSSEIGLIQEAESESIFRVVTSMGEYSTFPTRMRTKSGETLDLLTSVQIVELNEEQCLLGASIDVTEQKRAEAALEESEGKFRSLFNAMVEGVALHDIVYDEAGNPSDYIIRDVNHAYESILGIPREVAVGKRASELSRSHKSPNLDLYAEVARTGVPQSLEVHVAETDKHFLMSVMSPSKGRFAIVFMDISDRIRNETQIKTALSKLETSNRDLAQFAYVASHDLQEPLRMISSYLQLISRRYRGQIDKDADEFIDYAVDGAERLQTMINDLLEYSRVGTRGRPFVETDCNEVLKSVMSNLEVAIEDSGAKVTSDPLPTVVGDGSQLIQLFQNLIDNAMKFVEGKAPEVHVSAKREEAGWVFSVKDNGIGIDPSFKDKMFVIFQKLHPRGRYPGTGIGLSICKRIVERHSGRIWFESEPGKGTSFFFSIPDKKEETLLVP